MNAKYRRRNIKTVILSAERLERITNNQKKVIAFNVSAPEKRMQITKKRTDKLVTKPLNTNKGDKKMTLIQVILVFND